MQSPRVLYALCAKMILQIKSITDCSDDEYNKMALSYMHYQQSAKQRKLLSFSIAQPIPLSSLTKIQYKTERSRFFNVFRKNESHVSVDVFLNVQQQMSLLLTNSVDQAIGASSHLLSIQHDVLSLVRSIYGELYLISMTPEGCTNKGLLEVINHLDFVGKFTQNPDLQGTHLLEIYMDMQRYVTSLADQHLKVPESDIMLLQYLDGVIRVFESMLNQENISHPFAFKPLSQDVLNDDFLISACFKLKKRGGIITTDNYSISDVKSYLSSVILHYNGKIEKYLASFQLSCKILNSFLCIIIKIHNTLIGNSKTINDVFLSGFIESEVEKINIDRSAKVRLKKIMQDLIPRQQSAISA